MFVELVCPHCGQPLRIPEDQAGRSAQCGVCQGIFATKPAIKSPPAKAAPRAAPPTAPVPKALPDHIAPHRGGLILALAIIGWIVCPVTSVAAWIMGNSDLKAMKAERMDPEGEGLTKAGVILAMVQFGLFVFGILMWFVIAGVAIGVNAFH